MKDRTESASARPSFEELGLKGDNQGCLQSVRQSAHTKSMAQYWAVKVNKYGEKGFPLVVKYVNVTQGTLFK